MGPQEDFVGRISNLNAYEKKSQILTWRKKVRNPECWSCSPREFLARLSEFSWLAFSLPSANTLFAQHETFGKTSVNFARTCSHLSSLQLSCSLSICLVAEKHERLLPLTEILRRKGRISSISIHLSRLMSLKYTSWSGRPAVSRRDDLGRPINWPWTYEFMII